MSSLIPLLALGLPLFLGCKDKGGDSGTLDTDTDTDTDTSTDSGGDGLDRITVLHTNDWQSHMLGFGPNAEYTPDSTGDDPTYGGLARIKTLADEIRGASTHPVLMFDGGDWMAGDLFQLLGPTDAAELQAMQLIGYDAITLGNHEFDWGPDVLGQIIAAGDAAGVDVPILGTNTVPDTADGGDDLLEALFDSGRIEETRVITLDNGVTVGLFGLVGDEAGGLAPAAVPTTFAPAIDTATDAVAGLKAQGVDIIIALTHNGVTDDPSTSPDELLAAAVPDIDLIVGGHSHTPLFEPRVVGDTVIVQAGSHTRYMGELGLVRDGDGWSVESYELHEIDDTIAGDPDVTALIDGFIAELEAGPLTALGFDFAEPIVAVPGDLPYDSCVETAIGNYVTDAYRSALLAVPGLDPVDVAFETQGVIRDGLLHGNGGVQAFSDLFRVLPLGAGDDSRPGYPLVGFYVTGAELADACEVTVSVSPFFGCNYFVEHSGMRCSVQMLNTPFNRVEKVELLQDDAWVQIDTSAGATELYHVAVDSYTASLMYTLEGLTSGLLVITPKDSAGIPMSDLADAVIDADPDTAGVQELKLWEALVDYGRSMPDTDDDGLPDLDERYLAPDGRLVGFDD
ncbi:MAG: bifunctional metallophosphatase/5'-nucleotidase [Alphaproteobacteria bacterium]|nr:bifunctional metallophosphatase/5'-nucleotidase [Alphaproteobacteria bacterium]